MPQVISKNSSSNLSNISKLTRLSHFRCILLSVLAIVIAFFAGLYIGGQNSLPISVSPSVGINTQNPDQKVEVKKDSNEDGNQATQVSPSVGINTQNPDQKVEVKKGSYEDGYQAALDFARKKLDEKGMPVLSFKDGRSMLFNVAVKSVSGNSVTVEFDASRLDVLSEGTATKTIIIPDTVKIEKHTPKDPVEIQKDSDKFKKSFEEFQKTAKTEEEMKNAPEKPMTYTVENVNISNLKVGDILNVSYEADATNPDKLNAVYVELLNNPALIQNIKGDSGM